MDLDLKKLPDDASLPKDVVISLVDDLEVKYKEKSVTNSTILEMVQPVIDKVDEPGLRKALNAAFNEEIEALYQAENTFNKRTFIKSTRVVSFAFFFCISLYFLN